jgi:hypothetical protein
LAWQPPTSSPVVIVASQSRRKLISSFITAPTAHFLVALESAADLVARRLVTRAFCRTMIFRFVIWFPAAR